MRVKIPVFEELQNCRIRLAGEIEVEAEPRAPIAKPPAKEELRIWPPFRYNLRLEPRLVG